MSALLSNCSVSSCSFNHDGCDAPAITMSDNCKTFTIVNISGGRKDVKTAVGTCSRTNCAHNENLLCTAENVSVGGDAANCLSFEQA